MISRERLLARFRYIPETGELFWKERPQSDFVRAKNGRSAESVAGTWNTKFAGKIAGWRKDSRGYCSCVVDGECHLVHRLIWMMVHGEWPAELDHINRNPSDNRIANLRQVSRTANNLNRSAKTPSGVYGVSYVKRRKKWRARIIINDRETYLGSFDDIEDAIAARKAAEKTMLHQILK